MNQKYVWFSDFVETFAAYCKWQDEEFRNSVFVGSISLHLFLDGNGQGKEGELIYQTELICNIVMSHAHHCPAHSFSLNKKT